MITWFSALLLLTGAVFMILAALGIVRLPDPFLRMHAATKAASLGTILMAGSVAIFYGDTSVIFECILIVVLTFLTSPVACHVIGRAVYLLKIPMWKGSVIDELRNRNDVQPSSVNKENS